MLQCLLLGPELQHGTRGQHRNDERRGLSLPGGKRGTDQYRLLSHFCYPVTGLAEHLGVVDCTPPTSELV